MSNELILSNQDERTKLIKNTVAKGATDDELSMFMHIANKYNLDPLIKEIWFIKQVKKIQDAKGKWDYPRLPNKEIDYSGAEVIIMTSRDGYLKVAQSDPSFDGIISFPIREGDIFEVDAESYKVNHKFGSKRGDIIGAWAKVGHKNRKPVLVYADFSEYNSPKGTIWSKYPSAMIQKVAEVLALKRQFGISGLTTQEELTDKFEEHVNQSTVVDVTPKQPQPEPQPLPLLPQPEVIESESFFPEDPPPEPTELLSATYVTAIYALAKTKGYNTDSVNNSLSKSYSVENASQLSMAQYLEFKNRLESLKNKAVTK